MISLVGRAIHKYEKKSELLEALRNAVKAHRSLYLKGNILHRNMQHSENNVIITDPKETRVTGMLIDLDLAKELGTMEFMAIKVLVGISHTYRHDLESFLYVLIRQCIRCGWEILNKPRDQLSTYIGLSYRRLTTVLPLSYYCF